MIYYLYFLHFVLAKCKHLTYFAMSLLRSRQDMWYFHIRRAQTLIETQRNIYSFFSQHMCLETSSDDRTLQRKYHKMNNAMHEEVERYDK